jgi:heptosyltransferase-2
MNQAQWRKVLLLQTSFLGDTVLTLPLIDEIRRRFPSSHLAVLCNPIGRELLQDHPAIDELIVDDKKHGDKGFSGLRRKAELLKQKSFTIALTPHKSLRTALLLWLAAIPCRVGFRQSKGWFLFHHRAWRDPSRHDVERNLSVLQAVGLARGDYQPELRLPIADSRRGAVVNKLHELGYDPSRPLIGINPGSVWPMKRWSVEGFARVVDGACETYGCQAILFGAPEDREIAAKVESLCRSKPINSAGRLSLTDLPAAISLCQVFVTNDSGPMHIAAACDVPTVAIFCATAPSQGFYPYASNAIVVQKNLACRPCSPHGGRRCPLGSEDCIRQIEAGPVLAAVQRLWRREAAEGSDRSFSPIPEFVTV